MTESEHVAVLFPSAVVTVIVDVPSDRPVMSPVAELMDATLVLLDDQDTVLLEALAGKTVAVNVVVLPTVMFSVDLFKLTEVTDTGMFVTVIVAVPLMFVFRVEVAVMVVWPTPTGVTIPPLTVAIAEFAVDQVTLLSAFEGVALTVNSREEPMLTVPELGERAIAVGSTFWLAHILCVVEFVLPQMRQAYEGSSIKGFRL